MSAPHVKNDPALFNPEGTAHIYAPPCENHYANVLTDADDVSVGGSDAPYLYTV